MQLKDCHNFNDFRTLAQRRIPGPIFNYIDGAADDERPMIETLKALTIATLSQVFCGGQKQ